MIANSIADVPRLSAMNKPAGDDFFMRNHVHAHVYRF
jgi:hypothetical protein